MFAELRLWVKEVGFPIAVSLALLSLMLKAIPDLDSKVTAQGIVLDRHVETAYGRGTTIIRLLRLICRNGAPDRITAIECDRSDGPE